MRAKIVVPLLFLAAAAPAAAQRTVCTPPPPPQYGRQQSPINIVGMIPARMDRLGTFYPGGQGGAFFTGNDIQVNVAPGSYLTVDGVRFQLDEFHFHWPAEHRVQNDTFSVEIHMVHRSAAVPAQIAVVSTWVRIGAHNSAWDAMWAKLPTDSTIVPVAVDIPRMFSLGSLDMEQVYRYCGSLTTGPRPAEGVTWLVRNHPIEMSRHQVEALQGVMRRPWSRGLQALNGRTIRYWIP
ncbi:MAG TPA: carbonic anhydrase family protein [Longimicrobium sp.]|jgi:carbonic anhydrase|nr:carbonic anhydrase family protein [Longimicrobium sp.]